MLSRHQKRDLKAQIIAALVGKMPLTIGDLRVEVATTHKVFDSYVNLKVKDKDGNLLTYMEAQVHERF